MEKWKQRLADDDAEYAKQLELDVEIKTITEGANVRTRMKAKSAMADTISALRGEINTLPTAPTRCSCTVFGQQGFRSVGAFH